MNILRGIFRLTLISIVLGIGTVIILSTAWVPVRVRGVRLCAWPITIMARIFTRLFNIRYTSLEAETFKNHHGFVFPNHVSYLDVVMLIHMLPMRFVSTYEVRSWPFIGWIARAIDTVFLNRQDKSSRDQTRITLGQISHYPPIALFPEGGIFDTKTLLHPFRYGAFEIAAQGSVPFLPCVLLYDRRDVVQWGDESFLQAVWRLACFAGPINGRVFALKIVHPQPTDDPKQLALEAHGAMEAVLTYTGREAQVLESGI